MDRVRIRQLIQLLKSSSAQELLVRDGEQMVRIRRREGQPDTAQPSASPLARGAVNDQAAVEATVPVRANLVGLFYRGRGAGAEPLVQAGDQVEEGQVVGTIDALRRLTEVLSPAAGEVTEILAEDGQPIGYGEVLMRLESSEGEQ